MGNFDGEVDVDSLQVVADVKKEEISSIVDHAKDATGARAILSSSSTRKYAPKVAQGLPARQGSKFGGIKVGQGIPVQQQHLPANTGFMTGAAAPNLGETRLGAHAEAVAADGAPPIDQTNLSRSQNLPVRQRLPGAVAVSSGFGPTNLEARDSTQYSYGSTSNDRTIMDNTGLAVAREVGEEMTPRDLPHARGYDADDEERRRREKNTKQCKTNLFLGFIAIAAIVMIVLALVVSNKKESNEEATPAPTTQTPSVSPSGAPSFSLPGYVLSLLEEETVLVVESGPEPPQAKAYQWLLEDAENIPFYSDDRIKQKFILATLYYATAGEGWTASTNWLNHSVHECDWFTVEDFALRSFLTYVYPGYLDGFMEPVPPKCDDNGMYQHLWLDQNLLVGRLPEELYYLTNLQSLSIGYNGLTGTISTRIGLLSELEGLHIAGHAGAGTIPSEIGLLTKLETLGLSSNNHHGTIPSEIWQLTNMMYFGMGYNNELKGTLSTELGSWTNLRWFAIDECRLHGPIPDELWGLESLEWLALDLNIGLSGTIPSKLSPNLEMILVAHNLLEGTIPSELGLATNLFHINLLDNSLTGTIPSELGLLTNMQEGLRLKRNQLTGTLPTQLGLLSQLRVLHLSTNPEISGQIPSEFGQLTSLESLQLYQSNLSGTVPTELAPLGEKLYELDLSEAPLLSGTLPNALCSLQGECVSTALSECIHLSIVEGLHFDCTDLMCGCDCPCPNTTSSDGVMGV